jgi:hypothetical protein
MYNPPSFQSLPLSFLNDAMESLAIVPYGAHGHKPDACEKTEIDWKTRYGVVCS